MYRVALVKYAMEYNFIIAQSTELFFWEIFKLKAPRIMVQLVNLLNYICLCNFKFCVKTEHITGLGFSFFHSCHSLHSLLNFFLDHNHLLPKHNLHLRPASNYCKLYIHHLQTYTNQL
jgi:hypothetical protein